MMICVYGNKRFKYKKGDRLYRYKMNRFITFDEIRYNPANNHEKDHSSWFLLIPADRELISADINYNRKGRNTRS